MATVRMETMVQMRNEIETFKKTLVLALETGSKLPSMNTSIILNKYIGIATNELKQTMPTKTAQTLATNVLNRVLEDCMSE